MSSIQEKLKNEINNYQQVKRIEKVYNEEYYVLDNELESEKIKIFISGSTQNVYEISINVENGSLWCNCPDMKSFSKRFDCICKHCCFVILKIGKIFDSNVIKNKKLEENHIEMITDRLQSQIELKNVELSLKFMSMKEPQPLYKNHYKFDSTDKPINEEDECPICYDYLNVGEVKCCLDCKNYIHTNCMNKWLETKKTCVLCRSTCWSQLNNENKSESKYISLKN